MIEVIKHTLGLCGEHSHPSVLSFLVVEDYFNIALGYLKSFFWIK
jgi:hypothetical protein